MAELRVAIVDSGIDLQKLYGGERHGYEAVWVPIEEFSYSAIAGCHLLIIPAGSDETLLAARKDCVRRFLSQGGWVFCFDGMPEGVLDGLKWVHSKTDYKRQSFRIIESDFGFLFDGVSLDGLVSKDGVRGWWCEGELIAADMVSLLKDERNRVVVAIRPPGQGAGAVVATAAGRLPLFSTDPKSSPNVLFQNLLDFCGTSESLLGTRQRLHLYLDSGNWAHRSFLQSDAFGTRFTGMHWDCLDGTALDSVRSVWIPWESNVRALKRLWPLLDRAVSDGIALVVEDMRGDWLPGFRWEQRPVDSSWWREGRELDLVIRPEAEQLFPGLSAQAFQWHYHGVLECPESAIPLLTTRDGKTVLALCPPTNDLGGIKLVSTLDATFEYGVGKIRETATYIAGVLNLLSEDGCFPKN